MRIVFMGTPEFAVPSLRAMLDAGYDVVAAVTQPDRPSGRGNRLAACPVKLLALERGVPVYQFERIRRQEGLDALRALQPDLCVTAAFGQILSKKLLEVPPLGTINVHASLLPKYRGAAPINWAIAMGEKVTGVTIMYTDAGVDTGDIALARETDIGDNETAGELTMRLAELGAGLLIEALEAISRGDCPRTPQDEAAASHYPMLTRETGLIDWSLSAREICDRVRGFNPWPAAYTRLSGEAIKVWSALPGQNSSGGECGEVLASGPKGGLVVACRQGSVRIVELQAPGGRRMEASAYLLGKSIPAGSILK